MLPAITANHLFVLILTSTSLPYKRDNVDTTTKRKPKNELYINIKNYVLKVNGRSNQSQRITKRKKSG